MEGLPAAARGDLFSLEWLSGYASGPMVTSSIAAGLQADLRHDRFGVHVALGMTL
jgi:hypothetical protein